MIHKKNQNSLLDLLITCISTEAASQILLLKDEYT